MTSTEVCTALNLNSETLDMLHATGQLKFVIEAELIRFDRTPVMAFNLGRIVADTTRLDQ